MNRNVLSYLLLCLLFGVMGTHCARSLPDIRGFPCQQDSDCGKALLCEQGVCIDSEGQGLPDAAVPEEPMLIDDPRVCTGNPRTRPCYDGPAGTQDVGVCKAGVQTCQNNFLWGPCRDQITPTDEVCDGKDNDCNGKDDDKCKKP